MLKPAARLAMLLASAVLLACQAKDKPEQTLKSGAISPPWDSARYVPKGLEGYVYDGPESLFVVFKDIARIDSLSGDHKDWKYAADAVDTLRVSQMLDTHFVFPQVPEASMAYAYDDSYRDDTLFRNAYGNGLYSQDHPCAVTYVLSGQFMHPAKWLKAGMKEAEILSLLGKPAYGQPNVLRYLSRDPGLASNPGSRPDSLLGISEYEAFDSYEGVNFYFQGDSLFAAVLQRSRPCH